MYFWLIFCHSKHQRRIHKKQKNKICLKRKSRIQILQNLTNNLSLRDLVKSRGNPESSFFVIASSCKTAWQKKRIVIVAYCFAILDCFTSFAMAHNFVIAKLFRAVSIHRIYGISFLDFFNFYLWILRLLQSLRHDKVIWNNKIRILCGFCGLLRSFTTARNDKIIQNNEIKIAMTI